MSVFIETGDDPDTPTLLGRVLQVALIQNDRAKILTPAGQSKALLQRLRTCLSRSRDRQKRRGKKIAMFTMHSESFSYTTLDGKRFDCLVLWTEKREIHTQLEMLDDLLERVL